ncbi:hypothetical protein ACFC1R_28300 [Kitasatospora sp. NPDC056138]|uniref:hypothetical protein n=1 Tax=Kitasatospora sp. NPDC056138 TaxID=3345724 RepID=UPI0035DC5F85
MARVGVASVVPGLLQGLLDVLRVVPAARLRALRRTSPSSQCARPPRSPSPAGGEVGEQHLTTSPHD